MSRITASEATVRVGPKVNVTVTIKGPAVDWDARYIAQKCVKTGKWIINSLNKRALDLMTGDPAWRLEFEDEASRIYDQLLKKGIVISGKPVTFHIQKMVASDGEID